MILTCISIDRYIAVSKPLRYPAIVTIRLAKCTLAVSLIMAVAFFVIGKIPGTPLYKHTGPTWSKSLSRSMAMTIFDRVFMITLYSVAIGPISIGMSLNVKAIMIAVRQARAIAALRPPGAQVGENNGSIELKGVKTILLISTINTVAWSPSIVRLWSRLGGLRISPGLDVSFAFLTLVNFWSNALVFARTNAAYRRSAKRLFKSVFSRNTLCGLETSNGAS